MNLRMEKLKMSEENKIDVVQYRTTGTCCQLMQVKIENGKIADAVFYGGCNGNLKGIKSLITGMAVDEVIEKLSGITCGMKPTSCPDQLAKCLIEYKQGRLAPISAVEE